MCFNLCSNFIQYVYFVQTVSNVHFLILFVYFMATIDLVGYSLLFSNTIIVVIFPLTSFHLLHLLVSPVSLLLFHNLLPKEISTVPLIRGSSFFRDQETSLMLFPILQVHFAHAWCWQSYWLTLLLFFGTVSIKPPEALLERIVASNQEIPLSLTSSMFLLQQSLWKILLNILAFTANSNCFYLNLNQILSFPTSSKIPLTLTITPNLGSTLHTSSY